MYGNWANPFPELVGALFAMALGLVPLLALISFVRAAFDHDSEEVVRRE